MRSSQSAPPDQSVSDADGDPLDAGQGRDQGRREVGERGPGRDLVVDQHQRADRGQVDAMRPVDEVAGGMAVRLVEPAEQGMVALLAGRMDEGGVAAARGPAPRARSGRGRPRSRRGRSPASARAGPPGSARPGPAPPRASPRGGRADAGRAASRRSGRSAWRCAAPRRRRARRAASGCARRRDAACRPAGGWRRGPSGGVKAALLMSAARCSVRAVESSTSSFGAAESRTASRGTRSRPAPG